MKWDNVFPNVPDSFRERINETFETIIVYEKKERAVFMKKRTLIAALTIALSLAVLTMGAYAVIMNLWNPKLAEIFEADETMQEQLLNDGAASQPVNDSVTDNGVTVEVIQTLGDKRYIYILLKFSSENEKLLEAEGFGNDYLNDYLKIEGYGRKQDLNNRVTADGEETASYSMIASFRPEYDDETTGENGQVIYQRYYIFYINNKNQQEYNGRKFTVSFKNLIAYNGKLEGEFVLIEGDWEVYWVMEYQDTTQVFELNKEIDVNGFKAIIRTVELSPISMTFTLGGDDIEKINELDNAVSASFIFADGTTALAGGSGGTTKWNDERTEYIYSEGFDKIFSIEKIKGIELFFPNRGFIKNTVEFSLFD